MKVSKYERLHTAMRISTRVLHAAIIAGSLISASTAMAETHNPNIEVSQGELKAKCKRSGGTISESDKGTVTCVVRNNGSSTVVSCEKGKTKCDGYIFKVSPKPSSRKGARSAVTSGMSALR